MKRKRKVTRERGMAMKMKKEAQLNRGSRKEERGNKKEERAKKNVECGKKEEEEMKNEERGIN